MKLLTAIQANPLRSFFIYLALILILQLRAFIDIAKWLALSTAAGLSLITLTALLTQVDHLQSKKAIERERERAERTSYLAFHDSVTGMPNRNYFQGTLKRLLADKAQRVGVLMIDLHGFSLINDIAGHQAGYQLLHDAEKRLIANTPQNCVIANIWGDKFLLAIPGIANVSQLADVAETILIACGQPWAVDAQQFSLTVNIGICVSPDDGEEAITLMKNADMAVSRAKAQGKNQYTFYKHNFSYHALKSIELETRLHSALDNREFYLEYQPRISLSTADISSFEALIRWNNKELGTVGPGEFIPLAEATGLIESIGQWVLITACKQIKAWQDLGFDLAVSVNLSARQFYRSDLVNSIMHILDEEGVKPCKLELEITESMVMRDVDQAIKNINDLRAAGIRVSMDDFGTGHSSLTNLKRLPVDVLKIDKTFVQDTENSEESGAIVQAIIALGHILNLAVTAEGVETQRQLSIVRKAGCDEVQGFYFSRPVSPEIAYGMLLAGNVQAKKLKDQMALDSSWL